MTLLVAGFGRSWLVAVANISTSCHIGIGSRNNPLSVVLTYLSLLTAEIYCHIIKLRKIVSPNVGGGGFKLPSENSNRIHEATRARVNHESMHTNDIQVVSRYLSMGAGSAHGCIQANWG